MPRITQDLSRYVNARWVPFLMEVVVRSAAPDVVPPRDPRTALKPFDYRGIVRISALAERIARKDRGGESEAAWTRTIGRWINEGSAPEPETVRRVLDSLGFDWVVGLGRSGYKQHAIAMLHLLWADGARSRVSAQAMAIFAGSDYDRRGFSDRSMRVFRNASARETEFSDRAQRIGDLKTNSAHLERLHSVAESCWGMGEAIPTRCTPPRGLETSRPLFLAWILLDSALDGRSGSLESRLRTVDECVAWAIEAWIHEIAPQKTYK